jgi:hypothetical protein
MAVFRELPSALLARVVRRFLFVSEGLGFFA